MRIAIFGVFLILLKHVASSPLPTGSIDQHGRIDAASGSELSGTEHSQTLVWKRTKSPSEWDNLHASINKIQVLTKEMKSVLHKTEDLGKQFKSHPHKSFAHAWAKKTLEEMFQEQNENFLDGQKSIGELIRQTRTLQRGWLKTEPKKWDIPALDNFTPSKGGKSAKKKYTTGGGSGSAIPTARLGTIPEE